MKTIDQNNIMRADNDRYGNPRYVVHFSEFLTAEERQTMLLNYQVARIRAKRISARVYNGYNFGGGFIFQAVDERDACRKVDRCFNK